MAEASVRSVGRATNPKERNWEISLILEVYSCLHTFALVPCPFMDGDNWDDKVERRGTRRGATNSSCDAVMVLSWFQLLHNYHTGRTSVPPVSHPLYCPSRLCLLVRKWVGGVCFLVIVWLLLACETGVERQSVSRPLDAREKGIWYPKGDLTWETYLRKILPQNSITTTTTTKATARKTTRMSLRSRENRP
jgi:hypothetical protein